MKRIIFILLSFISTLGFSQTEISGIINTYSGVTAIDTCSSELTVNSVSGFNVGEEIILIQMQGAEIDESNNSSFGDILDLGSVGLFEIGKIKAVSGSKIQLENYLLNKYDLAGAIQIVSFPEYENAKIVGEILPEPWNGVTGGIVALNVSNELIFDDSINVSGMGFRGGETQSLTNNCTGGINNASNYFYPSTNYRGAKKGEGVAFYVPQKDYGRGAQANGGGGGNDHNSGGGGGGNYTTGGIGGERDLSFLSLECRGNNPGEAGKGINVSDNRVFLGGGGGAGHANNRGSSGGAGGGIVFCTANTVTVISGGIFTNGESVSVDAVGDGGGGGGAGGSIILQIENLNDDLNLEATGGTGANVDNRNTDRSFGPGGGGSGGVIKEQVTNRLNNSETYNFLDGGQPGLSINTTRGSNNTSNEAESGVSGRKSTFLGIPKGEQPMGAPIFVVEPAIAILGCQGIDIMITGEAAGTVTYRWQIFSGGAFLDLLDGVEYSGTSTGTLTINSPTTALDGTRFRLSAMNSCGLETFSQICQLSIQSSPIADFNYVVNGTQVMLANSSLGATDFLWNFGSGNTSPEQNPVYDFGMPGTYTIGLIASGPCGLDRKTEVVVISDNSAPTADFSSNFNTGCAPATFILNNESNGIVDEVQWIFPGGNPTGSIVQSPNVTYNSPGLYDVVLIVSNVNGKDTLIRPNYFRVGTKPVADFNFAVTGQDVSFNNSSVDGNSFLWEFGDNQSSVLENPNHTYTSQGTYSVRLIVENDCGKDTINQILIVGTRPTATFSSDKTGGCAPMSVNFSDNSVGTVLNRSWIFPGGDPATSSDPDVKVIYRTPGNYDVRLIVQNNAGADTSLLSNLVEVLPRPFAGFDFTVSGPTVSFTNTSTGTGDFNWNFGDGSAFSTEVNPIHTFPGTGSYVVTLNALNDFCSGSITQTVNIVSTSVSNLNNRKSVNIFPNPVSDFLNIKIEEKEWNYPVSIEVIDLAGRSLMSENEISKLETLPVGQLSPGIYFLKLKTEREEAVFKFIKVEN